MRGIPALPLWGQGFLRQAQLEPMGPHFHERHHREASPVKPAGIEILDTQRLGPQQVLVKPVCPGNVFHDEAAVIECLDTSVLS